MNDLRPTIVRLLSNMASAKEIQQYLKRFSQLDAARFAVVKVGGAILRDELDALVSSLAFLQQVGLTPIVLHGAGPQLDEEMTAAGIAKRTVDGLRVTDAATMEVAEMVLSGSINKEIVNWINRAGAEADVRGVGLSGKDARMITVTKARRTTKDPGSNIEKVVDLGLDRKSVV